MTSRTRSAMFSCPGHIKRMMLEFAVLACLDSRLFALRALWTLALPNAREWARCVETSLLKISRESVFTLSSSPLCCLLLFMLGSMDVLHHFLLALIGNERHQSVLSIPGDSRFKKVRQVSFALPRRLTSTTPWPTIPGFDIIMCLRRVPDQSIRHR